MSWRFHFEGCGEGSDPVNGQMGPGAFLTAPGGLYDGPEAAKVAATVEAVKRRGLDIKAEPMTDDVESRRRRAAFRATHRGTKEMDWLIGRFAEARLAGMPPHGLAAFERLLLVPDPQLYDMILYPEIAPAGEHAELVGELRAFHGLE